MTGLVKFPKSLSSEFCLSGVHGAGSGTAVACTPYAEQNV